MHKRTADKLHAGKNDNIHNCLFKFNINSKYDLTQMIRRNFQLPLGIRNCASNRLKICKSEKLNLLIIILGTKLVKIINKESQSPFKPTIHKNEDLLIMHFYSHHSQSTQNEKKKN